jgi:hypothetical protein
VAGRVSARDVVRAVPDLPDDERGSNEHSSGTAASPPRGRAISGRVRHEEKMTIYVSPEELHDLDLARLVVSRDYGLKVDRGRVVREAVAMLLADFDEHGADSVLVRRLRNQ